MNPQQREYLIRHGRSKSVKELAEVLKMDRKEVQRELRRLSAGTAAPAAAPRAQEAPPQPARFHALVAVILSLFVFAVYFKSLSYPFVNWDDPQYITENQNIRSLSAANLKRLFTHSDVGVYVPLTTLTFAVDYQFHHFNPGGYRWTNLLLHIANTVLVYLLLLSLTGDWRVAAAAALIFGVHPVQPESVVWISQRKNVLSNLLFLLGFHSYLLSRKERNAGLYYALSLSFFLLGCLAKALIVVMPALLLAYDYCYGQLKRKELRRYVPYVLCALVFAGGAYFVARGSGAEFKLYGGSVFSTVLTGIVVMARYFELLVLPLRQSILYVFPAYNSIADPTVFLSLLTVLLVGAGLVTLFRREKKIFFWAAWFFIFLGPVLNIFVPTTAYMQDRWLYLPLLGFFTCALLLIRKWLGPAALLMVTAAAVSGFTVLNVRRQEIWSHPEKFWRETQSRTLQENKSPYLNLGMYYAQQGELDRAIEEFHKVLAIMEDPKAYDGLGIVYFKKGEPAKAIEYFKKAIEKEPTVGGIHSNLALVYQDQQQYELALAELKKAIELEPGDAKYRNNLGSLHMQLGNKLEARDALLEALKLDPDSPEALYNLGALYMSMGKIPEAREQFQRFVRIHPNHPKVAKIRSEFPDL